MNKIYEKQRITELEQALAEAQQAREQLRLAVTDDLVVIDTLRGFLRFAETMFVALRDGIDTEQMHCLPLDMTSSWRYIADKALERITAALKEVEG